MSKKVLKVNNRTVSKANSKFINSFNSSEIQPGHLRVPSAYQEVEYLESTGTQYIATNVRTYNDKDFHCTAEFDVTFKQHTAGDRNLMGFSSNSGWWFGDAQPHEKRYQREVFDWIKSEQKIYRTEYYNNELLSKYSGLHAGLSNSQFLLFCLMGSASWMCNALIYWCRIYLDDTLVRNFIPCYRKSDGKPGLYDTVDNIFYINSGTGEFVLGPSVLNNNLYQQVEYLESTGVQWIDTEVKSIIAPFKITTKFNLMNDATADKSIFGLRTLGKFVNCYSTYYETIFGNTVAGTRLTNQLVEMTLNSASGITLNGTSIITGTSGNRSSTDSAYMFAFRENSTTTASWLFIGRIYFYRILASSNTSHDFIPCYRKSDGKPGMYDVITGKFFTNKGTGLDFILGPSILPIVEESYQQLSYLYTNKTNGSIYITTSENNVKVLGKAMYLSYVSSRDSVLGRTGTTSPRIYYYAEDGKVHPASAQYLVGDFALNVETSYSVYGASAEQLILLGMYNAQNTNIRVYFYRIFDNNVLFKDLIPCKNIVTNQIGLLDLVSNEFITSTNNAYLNGPIM